MTDPDRLPTLAVQYAWTLLGTPYRWAGDDPIQGFDCSGFVVEVLAGVGLFPHGHDATADELLQLWRDSVVDRPTPGCLIFWKNAAGRATHVEIVLDGEHTIGASGGGSSTTDEDQAAKQNAFVKIRPIKYRGPSYVVVDPFSRRIPMTLKQKAKVASKTIIEAIITAITVIPGLLKKKPYTLWYWPAKDPWEERLTSSARQCKKTQAALVDLGSNPAWFAILRKGVKPPPGGPKPPQGGRI